MMYIDYELLSGDIFERVFVIPKTNMTSNEDDDDDNKSIMLLEQRIESLEACIKQQNHTLMHLVQLFSQQTIQFESFTQRNIEMMNEMATKIERLEHSVLKLNSNHSENTPPSVTPLYEHYKFNDEQTQLLHKANGFVTTPVNHWIGEGPEMIQFELVNMSSYRCVQFGIVREDDCDFSGIKYLTANYEHSYSVDLFDGHKRNGCRSSGVYFPKDTKSGDVIGIKLNISDRTLSYYVNDKCLGIAFENIDTSRKWIYAVTLWYAGDCICIN
jgi:uncharacterized coiled-coil protein SlyX